MDPALLKLMRLQSRGLVRRMTRGARTPRGAVMLALGVVLFLVWLGVTGATANFDRPRPEHVRAVGPVILLAVCLLTALTSAGDKAVAFTPGEVDFLFPGPFTRRQLLAYKLTRSTVAAAVTSLVMSVVLLRNATMWVACYVGVFLTLLLIQFLSTALVLLAQTSGERAFARIRAVFLIVVGILLVVGGQAVLTRYPLTGPGRLDVPFLIQAFARSPAGRLLLWPFAVFIRVITAERVFPDLLNWAGQAAFIDALLLAVVVKLDANYLEAAAGATRRRYERLRRVRAGGALALGAGRTARRRLPRPPFWFGAGPIAWRQLTHAVRSARSLLLVLAFLAVILGPFAVSSYSHRGRHAASGLYGLFSVLAAASVMLASLLRFDFRADLDAMESLKVLPLRPWAVAVGQLVAPTLVLTLVHGLILAAVAVASGLRPDWRAAVGVAVVLVVPFNALLFATENLVFLLAPSRPAAVGPGDFQVLGRQLITLVLRGVVVATGVGIAAGFGIVAYSLTTGSLAALTLVTATVLSAEVVGLVPLLAWAYARFDPSAHTPA